MTGAAATGSMGNRLVLVAASVLLSVACDASGAHNRVADQAVAEGPGSGGNAHPTIVVDTILERCVTCRIVLTPVASLSSSVTANFFFSTRVTYLPSVGHFFAAPLLETGRVAEFDETGRLLGLRLSEGDGPGEMRRIRFLKADAANTLLVIGSDFRVVRLNVATESTTTSRLPSGVVPEDVLPLPGGDLAVDNSYPTHPRIVVVGSGNQIRASVGSIQDPASGGASSDSARMLPAWLGRDTDAGFWECSKRYSIRLNHWSPDGEWLETLIESPSWFPPYTPEDEERRGRGLLPSQAKPFPVLTACYEDTNGLLWVIASVADTNYRATDPVDPRTPLITIPRSGIPSVVYRDWSRYTDAIVQVIDPRHHAVVATARFPQSISITMGTNLVDQITPTMEGDFVHRVSTLGLIGFRAPQAGPDTAVR